MYHLRKCRILPSLVYNTTATNVQRSIVSQSRSQCSKVLFGSRSCGPNLCKPSSILITSRKPFTFKVSEWHHDSKSYFMYYKYIASVGLMSFLGFSKKSDEEEDELILTIKRSVLLIQQGEMKKAERMLHVALRLAQQKQNADGITYIYDLLANIALENGEFIKSEKLFVNVMQRLLGSGVPADDNRVIHMSLKLAEIYVHQADNPKFEAQAKEGFKFCMDALQKKIDGGDKDPDTLLLLSLAAEGNGKMLAQQGQYKEARSLLQRALELSESSQEDSAERQSSLISDLGAVCSMGGDDDSALGLLQKAVDVGRKANVDNLPAFLVNLGLLSLYKGLKTEASLACNEAWKLSRSKNNKESEKEAMYCLEEIKKL